MFNLNKKFKVSYFPLLKYIFNAFSRFLLTYLLSKTPNSELYYFVTF